MYLMSFSILKKAMTAVTIEDDFYQKKCGGILRMTTRAS